MRSLNDFIRPENIFFTVDSVQLRNLEDFVRYINTCNELSFKHHVTKDRNDFSGWLKNVLLLNQLADSLDSSKDLLSFRLIVNEFFNKMTLYNKSPIRDKAFHAVCDVDLVNLYDLYYMLCNTDDWCFYNHVTPERNDFASWIRDAMSLPEFSAKLVVLKKKEDFLALLKNFIMNQYYEFIVFKVSKKPVLQIIEPSLIKSDVQKTEATKTRSDVVKEEEKISQTILPQPVAEPEVKPIVQKIVEAVVSPIIDSNADKKEDLKQYSDEELDGFVKFSKQEKPIDFDTSVEFLKTALAEMRTAIGQLYKEEKNPLIPDLMTKAINAKIDYYAMTKDKSDYDRVMSNLSEIQKEIESCKNEKSVNFAQEIMDGLELQKIMLKKA